MSTKKDNTEGGPLRLFGRQGPVRVQSVTAQDSMMAMEWARQVLHTQFGPEQGELILRRLSPMAILVPYALLLEQGGEN